MSERECVRSFRRVLIHLNIAQGILTRTESADFLDKSTVTCRNVAIGRVKGAVEWVNCAINWETQKDDEKEGGEK